MFPRLCATPTTASHVRCPPPSAFSADPSLLHLSTSPSPRHQTSVHAKKSGVKKLDFEIFGFKIFKISKFSMSFLLPTFGGPALNAEGGGHRTREAVVGVAQRRGNTRGQPWGDWDKNGTYPQNSISGDISLLAFEWARLA